MINKVDLDNWFMYHKPSEQQIPCFTKLREAARTFAQAVLDNTPPGEDQAMAIRKIRESVMTANAAIACNEVHVTITQVANYLTFESYYRGQLIHKLTTTQQELGSAIDPNIVLYGFYEESANISELYDPELFQYATKMACQGMAGSFVESMVRG